MSNLWIVWFDPLLMAAATGAGGGGGGDRAGGTGGGRDRAGGAGGGGAVGSRSAGYDQVAEPPWDARSGRRGHRALAGDAAGHFSTPDRPHNPAPAFDVRGTRSPAPSCSQPPHSKKARMNLSRIEAGEGFPTFRDEIVPPNVLHPAAASTPVLPSLSGLKRKRTPRPASMPQDEITEQVFADDEGNGDLNAEEDVGDRRGNEDLNAEEDVGDRRGNEDRRGQMGDGWSE